MRRKKRPHFLTEKCAYVRNEALHPTSPYEVYKDPTRYTRSIDGGGPQLKKTQKAINFLCYAMIITVQAS